MKDFILSLKCNTPVTDEDLDCVVDYLLKCQNPEEYLLSVIILMRNTSFIKYYSKDGNISDEVLEGRIWDLFPDKSLYISTLKRLHAEADKITNSIVEINGKHTKISRVS